MSNNNQTVKLSVNAEKLVQHLRHAFSRTETLLGEFMQNARRAAATKVAFVVNEHQGSLTVEDDGCGLKNPQDMFSIGDSGWDAETVVDERPYGMGFMAAIYAAKVVTIRSCGKMLEVKTRDLLDFKEIAVEEDTEGPSKGARIQLHGWSLGTAETRWALAEYARGFPIPVFFNEEELQRPHAINGELVFKESCVGAVSIKEIDEEMNKVQISILSRGLGSKDTHLYLQGLPIGKRSHGWNICNVVHLDPKQFTGRMPDRATLVDEEKAVRRIEKAITQFWVEKLRQQKNDLPAEEFAAVAFQTAKAWECLDLFDDIDYLPPQVLMIADAYPRNRCEWEKGNSLYSGPLISREMIEGGTTKVVVLHDEEDEEGKLLWEGQMYAFLHQSVLYNNGALPASHWIYPLLTHVLNDELQVTLESPDEEETFEGGILWAIPVVVCDGYTIDGPIGKVHGRVPWYGYIDGYVAEGSRRSIIFPREAGEADVILQVDDFWDGDDEKTLTREEEEEEARLLRFIRSRIPGEQESILRALLNDLDMRSYPGLIGKNFEVRVEQPVDRSGRPNIVVQIVETRDAL